MKIFFDSANLGMMEKWLRVRGIDGITTNPTILKNDGFCDPMDAWRQIIQLKSKFTDEPLPLSAEVFCDEPHAMLEQAREIHHTLAYPGLAIKIPILGVDGIDRLEVIRQLAEEKIRVNCTGCLTWQQAFFAAKAGASYVSLLYRRCLDEGLDGLAMIRETRRLIDVRGLSAEIIAGSIRMVQDVFDTYEAGAHIVTVPPKFFSEILFHERSRTTQEQFLRDAGVLS